MEIRPFKLSLVPFLLLVCVGCGSMHCPFAHRDNSPPWGYHALFNGKDLTDKPVGQWNRFHIKMIGEKVTVWLNDKLVVDNVTLENYWDRKKPIYPIGQIELQNHSSQLWFKNIYVKEISRQ